MANPKRRHSKSRRGKRRSHLAMRPQHAVVCPNCGAAKRPHQACPSCGYVRPGLTIKTHKGD